MKRLNAIAFYLPQYHRIPENDEWWGKGFTEWTAVKAAEKYFDGQYQPREPLNDNYYDLMQKDTMQWQADIASKYGVNGFCLYHYYFRDGRKILEKPLENLLQWTDINIPFCLCWANETWARTWSNLYHKNTWAGKFEKKNDKGQTILLEQAYGEEEEWKEHFLYLLPFFLDSRYIKVDNKPVFLFYRPDDIPQLNNMIQLWSNLLQKEGFEGLYAIGVNMPYKIKGLDANLFHTMYAYTRPDITGMSMHKEYCEGVLTYDYQKVWNNVICTQPLEGIQTYFGGFVDQDETPRRGKGGWCLTDVTPQKFEENLYDLAIKNLNEGNKFLFLDAWNEWGEGNYLEPDKKFGYQYLQALKNVMCKCNLNELDIASEWENIKVKRKIGEDDAGKLAMKADLTRYREYYKVLDRWLRIKEKKETVEKYFLDHQYSKIIIYGFAALGVHLYEDLKTTSIEVVCAIDKRVQLQYEQLEIRELSDEIPECDAIVVSDIFDFNGGIDSLQEKTDKPIISLQEVLFY